MTAHQLLPTDPAEQLATMVATGLPAALAQLVANDAAAAAAALAVGLAGNPAEGTGLLMRPRIPAGAVLTLYGMAVSVLLETLPQDALGALHARLQGQAALWAQVGELARLAAHDDTDL